MNMKLNMNIGRAIFLHIKDWNTRSNLVKNNIFTASIKNENRAVTIKKYFM